MTKRFFGLLAFVLVLCVAFIGCPTEDEKKEDVSTTDTPAVNPSPSDKISSSSLQKLIDDTPASGTIDLSQHSEITDFSATVNKAVTIKNGSLQGQTLTVTADKVNLSGLTDASVTASSSLGNGSLKIASSSLSSLKINGGGINSISIKDCTIDAVDVNKDMSANNAEYVRLDCSGDNEISSLSADSSVFIDGNAMINTINLKNGINISTTENSTLKGTNNVVVTFTDETTDPVTMRLITKKGSYLDGAFVKASFGKYSPKSYLDDKIINATCNESKLYNEDAAVKLFDTSKKTITLKLRIEDLSTDVGAVHAQYWVNDNINTNWTANDNGLVNVQIDNDTSKRYAEIVIDNYPYGVDFTFKLIFLAERISYLNIGTNWEEDVLPSMQPQDHTSDYQARVGTIYYDDHGQSHELLGAFCGLSTCMILGKGVSGENAKNYDLTENEETDWQAIRCTFAEHHIFGDCTITVNKETFPEIYYYYADEDHKIESQPIFPTNCGRLGPIRPKDHRNCFKVTED